MAAADVPASEHAVAPGRPNVALASALVIVASVLLSTAWMVAISPFRAMDEFDHAFRADSVSNGYWAAQDGDRVVVDRTLDAAVRPVCETRRFVPGACEPKAGVGADKVLTVSTAGAYNPVFYWFTGTISSPFDGYQRLYAMRLLLVLVNSLLVGTAFVIALRCFTSAWPAWAVVLTLTPQATAANMVMAPNGLESTCALVVWVSLMAAAHGRPPSGWERRLPWIALVAGTWIGFLRSLGPVWLVCIAATVLVSLGLTSSPRAALRDARGKFGSGAWRVCAVAWALAGLGGLAWALASGTNSLGDDASSLDLSTTLTAVTTGAGDGANAAVRPLVWLFQLVGALPYRNQPLPLVIYPIVLAVWAALAVAAARVSVRGFRRAAGAAAAVSLAIPLAFDLVTGEGALWQGRYCWPLVMGVFVVLGVGADRGRTAAASWSATGRLVVLAVVGVLCATMSWAVLHVVAGERRDSPLSGSASWWTVPDAVLALVPVVAGVLLVTAVAVGRGAGPSPSEGAGTTLPPEARSQK